jgi:hypothetical protein
LGNAALNTALKVFILNEVARRVKEATCVDIDISEARIDLTAPERQLYLQFRIRSQIFEDTTLEYTIDTTGQNNINIVWKPKDSRFGVRFSAPFKFIENNLALSEALLNVNVDITNNLTFTIGASVKNQNASQSTRLGFGLSLKF